jgi:hypothetical protein
MECIEELLNATSARLEVFPKAAGEDNFLQMFHEVSSGFQKPLNMGDNSFRKLFYYCTSDLIEAVQILYIYIYIYIYTYIRNYPVKYKNPFLGGPKESPDLIF